MGNFKKARDNFIKAMLLFKKTRDPRGIIYCRLGLGELDFLEGREAIAMRKLNGALFESIKNSFAIERCHASTILSYMNKNNPPTPPFNKGGQGGLSEKIDDRCYNTLGLRLEFQGLPFNIP
jgi:hypothetical protein